MIATSRTPTAAAAIPILPLVLVFWMRVPIYLDLCVEDVLFGLDGLRADLRGQLHRESCALDGHDDRRGVAGGAGCERLRRACRLGLLVREPLDRLGERAAEVRAALLLAGRGRGRLDLPLGAAREEAGIDRERHQRRRSSVLVNICLAACRAVTFASYEREAVIRSVISVTDSTFGMRT